MFSYGLTIAIACRLMRRHDEKEWKGSKFLRIVQQQSCILQTRTESLKPFIISGVWWSVEFVLPPETQKSHFCVPPWSLLTILNFSERGPTDTTVFNLSTPSSRTDNRHTWPNYEGLWKPIPVIGWAVSRCNWQIPQRSTWMNFCCKFKRYC